MTLDAGALVISIVGAIAGGAVWLVRALLARLMRELDERFGRIEADLADARALRAELDRLRAELPMYYQRREDSIREYTAINAKLDRLYELMMGNRHVASD
ncbi:MAG: hypothetical protein KatS3mg119_1901 [Rhodothalassiaceae bacterium]|nr:MAG: hypothetical protein KatS3mg119_1901 [Rhodothalassiaceae bacterium]